MIKLKTFQDKAIADLRKTFLKLWKTNKHKIPLIFKSPTGSGKTIMISQFLRDLTGDPQFDVDRAYIWISFSEDSYIQSKRKLSKYYRGTSELELLDYTDLTERVKLKKNNVFFVNWQKLKASSKEGRKLRKDNELTYGDCGIFDEFINNTHEEGREIVLLVDEAHRETDTKLAGELIDIINPRIILRITATPKNIPKISEVMHLEAGYVEVDREEVVKSGLIKEKIVTQTKEDLDKYSKSEMDQDNLLIEMAYEKRLELLKAYKKLDLNINPIVLIQLPNDDKAREETENKSKLEIVQEYLIKKKIDPEKIAIWLSEKKENLEDVESNDSDIDFLIFKQAASTGWDCPRASILVMFREIKNPIFHTQTLGRVLRMPEGKHYPIPKLNIGYLYTNYQRNQISLPDGSNTGNKPFTKYSSRKKDIAPITLESTLLSRTDYNDLGDSFQFTFYSIADEFFSIKKNDKISDIKSKLTKKGLEIDNVKIENELIVNAECEDYDNFVEEIKERGKDLAKETSKNDVIRLYNLLCFELISKQEEENKKFAPERSWGKLKTAMNVWFKKKVNKKRDELYIIIVNDLLKTNSVLKNVISKSLEVYRPIRQQEVHKKAMRAKSSEDLEIPPNQLSFTDDYESIEKIDDIVINKNAMNPFYMLKKYEGKKNESNFIKFIEVKDNVEWWHKNGDKGSEHFAISYYDNKIKKERLFYPDWFIKLSNKKLLIIDTKAGRTATEEEVKDKAEALQNWIKKLDKENIKIEGGIALKQNDIWKINSNPIYTYDDNLKNWETLDKLFERR